MDDKQMILDLHKWGMSYYSIAKLLNTYPSKVFYTCNPENKKRQDKKYAQENKQKIKDRKLRTKERIKQKRKEYRKNNLAIEQENQKRWLKENAAYYSTYNSKRRALQNNATLKISKEQEIQIKNFYIVARALSAATKVKYHVDHIHPIKGDNCTGLHVPWNLQILTASENCAKGNRYRGR